ncbi:hypothetical protein [Actinopolymorpha rutila]|uniref:Uncharacterized protein n=1 Tax=Actinopolymorpha rutila TaxID=446787 RepID=A0A852ZN32_9ACTN|nr:hypothetical protein [Actinopolymorpha rutila]NYH92962.1 hypothetical protein [Actinopolymorpha rutila]
MNAERRSATVGEQLAALVAEVLRRLSDEHAAVAADLAARAGYWRTDPDAADHHAAARVLAADAEALEQSLRPGPAVTRPTAPSCTGRWG